MAKKKKKTDISSKLYNGAGYLIYGLLWVGSVTTVAHSVETGLDQVAELGSNIKEVSDPTPVKVKTGLFKTRVVKRNPFTGTISAYTGTKAPINTKAIKIPKGVIS